MKLRPQRGERSQLHCVVQNYFAGAGVFLAVESLFASELNTGAPEALPAPLLHTFVRPFWNSFSAQALKEQVISSARGRISLCIGRSL